MTTKSHKRQLVALRPSLVSAIVAFRNPLWQTAGDVQTQEAAAF